MTIHISLSGRLENLVHSKIETGAYKNADEVIEAALTRLSVEDEFTPEEMFYLDGKESPVSFEEMGREIERRRENIRSGKAQWVDGKEFFARMEQYINDFPV